MKSKRLIGTLTALAMTFAASNALAGERIISAGAAVTELIIALEQQDKLVAVDVTSQLPSDLVLPKIGYHRQLSAEGLLALGADQLIGSDEMGPDAALDQLKSAGVSVDIVNTKATAAGLLERIDEIAELTDAQPQAAALKVQVKNQLQSLSQQPQACEKQLKTINKSLKRHESKFCLCFF